MKRLALVLIVTVAPLWLGTCASGGAVKSSESFKPKKGESTVRKREKRDFQPVSKKGKRWGGWKWKGKSDDCYFRVKRRCFPSEKKACAAARCGSKACEVRPGAPTLVYCEGKEPAELKRSDDAEDDDEDEADEAADEPKAKKRKRKKRKRKKRKRKR